MTEVLGERGLPPPIVAGRISARDRSGRKERGQDVVQLPLTIFPGLDWKILSLGGCLRLDYQVDHQRGRVDRIAEKSFLMARKMGSGNLKLLFCLGLGKFDLRVIVHEE